MKRTLIILVVGMLSTFSGRSAIADDQPSSTDRKVVYGSDEYRQLEQIAKDNRNVDEQTKVLWAKAAFDPDTYERELLDFYKGRKWRKAKRRDPDRYIRQYVYDVAEKLHSTEDCKLPRLCLVASHREIEEKIVECFMSRNREKLESGLLLAAKKGCRLPDGKHARVFKVNDEWMPVMDSSDVPVQTEAVSGWSLFYLEPSEDGKGVEYIEVPREYKTPEEFQDARYIEAMLELCQHLGAKSIDFKGFDEKKTELRAKGQADATVNVGPVVLKGTLAANLEEDDYTIRISKISNRFKGSATIQTNTNEYSPYLRRKLDSERRANLGELFHIYRGRTGANALEGRCVLYHARESRDDMALSVNLRAGFKLLGIPLGPFADVKIAARKNEEISKVRAWEIVFPASKESSTSSTASARSPTTDAPGRSKDRAGFTAAVYVPGWCRNGGDLKQELALLAEAFPGARREAHPWEGDGVDFWACRDEADVEGRRFGATLAALPEEERGGLALVGHSLGARVVVRALAALAAEGKTVRCGVLLGAALPEDDPDLAAAARGCAEVLVVVSSRGDAMLKWLYGSVGEISSPPNEMRQKVGTMLKWLFGSVGEISSPPNEMRQEVGEMLKWLHNSVGEGLAQAQALGLNGWPAPVPTNVVQRFLPPSFTDGFVPDAPLMDLDAMRRLCLHYAPFYLRYLADLGKTGTDAPLDDPDVVRQGHPNLELPVVDKEIWWVVEDRFDPGWKLERNTVFNRWRILDSKRIRRAWGNEADMRRSFNELKKRHMRSLKKNLGTGLRGA